MHKSKLILIPTPLGNVDPAMVLPSSAFHAIESLNSFIVEDIRSARRFIRKVSPHKNIDNINFYLLNEHTKSDELADIIKPLLNGIDTGLLSEAGMPAIADPGTSIIRMAHRNNIQVVPISGPSSIALSLMASGLNGQNFCFNGYLPIKQNERIKTLRTLELDSAKTSKSHIFIEAPYRNNKLFADIVESLKPETNLCVACNIGEEDEFIFTKNIAEWKKNILDLHKKPSVFILQV
ncbi:MAG: SAM-dependent methyltransferase [Bacteroidales bacterium]|nr:SAM-dependent methyltransferase [Bacteroidales bacterium]